MNPKLVFSAGMFFISEVLPFIPGIKGNGIVHTIIENIGKHKVLIETVSQVDIDNDGVIGFGSKKSASTISTTCTEMNKELIKSDNHITYSGLLKGVKFNININVEEE